MRWGTLLAFGAGLALLGFVIVESKPTQALALLGGLDPYAGLWVLLLFTLAWAAEIQAWALTFLQRATTARWFGRLWLVNMVGEALNVVMPFGSLGGEPVKAWLLKRHYAVGYAESGATLVLMQTLLALAEALFVVAGALIAGLFGLLPPSLAHLLYAAAAILAVTMALAVFGLHRRWLRDLVLRLERRIDASRFAAAKRGLFELEDALATFARLRTGRFTASTALFVINWIGGAAEVWLILTLLDATLPFAHCWVAEAAIVTIRSLTFFLPAQIGSVEAVTVWVVVGLGGTSEAGLALAALRRVRELLWAALGLGVGAAYNLEWRGAPRR